MLLITPKRTFRSCAERIQRGSKNFFLVTPADAAWKAGGSTLSAQSRLFLRVEQVMNKGPLPPTRIFIS